MYTRGLDTKSCRHTEKDTESLDDSCTQVFLDHDIGSDMEYSKAYNPLAPRQHKPASSRIPLLESRSAVEAYSRQLSLGQPFHDHKFSLLLMSRMYDMICLLTFRSEGSMNTCMKYTSEETTT